MGLYYFKTQENNDVSVINDASVWDGYCPFQANVGAGRTDKYVIGARLNIPFHISVNDSKVIAVEVEGHGTIGLITYLRTDSVRVSAEADAAVRKNGTAAPPILFITLWR